jgi:hypothetical protein
MPTVFRINYVLQFKLLLPPKTQTLNPFPSAAGAARPEQDVAVRGERPQQPHVAHMLLMVVVVAWLCCCC